ncbi:MAG: hypothetical protein IJQ81_07965 [Oscillibacter sp.]|nr:hypothetical protein [Oscillibacter sp.]
MKEKKIWLIPAVLALALLCACGQDAATTDETPENEQEVSAVSESQSANPNLATRVAESEDHYIFQLNENVTREKGLLPDAVRYRNLGGFVPTRRF